MSYITAFDLIKGKTYNFSVHYDLINKVNDKMPHFYTATFIEITPRKVWKFENFKDQETGINYGKQEFQHFSLKNPVIGLVDDVEVEKPKKSKNGGSKKRVHKTRHRKTRRVK